MKNYIIIDYDENEDKLISGMWSYDHFAGGVLQIPSSGSLFTGSSVGQEILFYSGSDAVYVRNAANTNWNLIGGGKFIVTSATSSISARALTGLGFLMTDGGPGSTITVSAHNAVIAMLSGSTFSGLVSASAGLSGSLQQIGPNLPYLLAGNNITLTTNSVGQVTITGTVITGSTGADVNSSYIVLQDNTNIPNDRVLTASGSSLSLTDGGAGSTVTLDIANTGSANIYHGRGVLVNSKGQVTSGTLAPFGSDFWFITGSAAQAFSNASANYLSAIALTASNLDVGIYRFGWSYTYRNLSNAVSFRARCVIYGSASYDTVEEVSDVGANERHMRSGYAYVTVTGSTGIFSLDISNETGTTALHILDRALELWKVS
jgi:hypothetical protein